MEEVYVITANDKILAVADNEDLAHKISEHQDIPDKIHVNSAPVITDDDFLGIYRVEFFNNWISYIGPELIEYVPSDYATNPFTHKLPDVRGDAFHHTIVLCLAHNKEEALNIAINEREKHFLKTLGIKTNSDDYFGIYKITFDKYGNMPDVGPILLKRVNEDYDFGVPKVSGDPEKHITVTCKANSNADAVYKAVVARTEYIKLYNHDALNIRYWSEE
jgi:hypothetical protein